MKPLFEMLTAQFLKALLPQCPQTAHPFPAPALPNPPILIFDHPEINLSHLTFRKSFRFSSPDACHLTLDTRFALPPIRLAKPPIRPSKPPIRPAKPPIRRGNHPRGFALEPLSKSLCTFHFALFPGGEWQGGKCQRPSVSIIRSPNCQQL